MTTVEVNTTRFVIPVSEARGIPESHFPDLKLTAVPNPQSRDFDDDWRRSLLARTFRLSLGMSCGPGVTLLVRTPYLLPERPLLRRGDSIGVKLLFCFVTPVSEVRRIGESHARGPALTGVPNPQPRHFDDGRRRSLLAKYCTRYGDFSLRSK